MEIKRKNLQFKVADIDGKKRLVKAYYSAFGNVDRDGEVIVKGAGRKTIAENGPQGKDFIRHFLNHEFKTNPAVLPIGKIKEIGEDNHGNFFVSKIARTKMGNDIYSMYEDDMIDNHSFGFGIVKEKIENNIKYILEYKMLEISTITTWAANPDTHTIDVKDTNTAVIKNTVDISQEALFIKPSTMTLKDEAAMNEFVSEFLKSNIFDKLKI